MEHTKIYKGLYHVLHGAISPTEGIGSEDIKIKELLELDTPSYIFNAEDTEKLEALIKGKETVCTVIRPKG